MNYGYVRVSTKEQNSDRQYDALRQLYPDIIIFEDKASGKNFNRSGYKKLLKVLKEGDVLHIQDLDRLGRNYEEILEEWRYITKEIKADITVLNLPLLDTRNNSKGFSDSMVITDIVLSLMSYLAQREREMIKQRQREGIEAAKRRGQKLGQERKITKEAFSKFYERECLKNNVSRTHAAEMLGISYRTFLNYYHEYYKEHSDDPKVKRDYRGSQKQYTETEFAEIYQKYCIEQGMTKKAAASKLGISYNTFLTYCKEYRSKHDS